MTTTPGGGQNSGGFPADPAPPYPRFVAGADIVEVSFTLNQAEFTRGLRANWLRSPSFFWLPVAGALALVVGLLVSEGLLIAIGSGGF
jgi:hypothetical protein